MCGTPGMSKTRVLLLFGGQSAEHEVSVVSARSVYLSLIHI